MDSNYRRVNPNERASLDYRNSDFQRLLYQLVIYEKKINLIELAEHLGKKPDTIYAYCEGELRLHVDEVRRIIAYVAAHDPKETRLVDYFCAPAGFLAMPKLVGMDAKKVRAVLMAAHEITKRED
jgi:hypothetical protein